MQNKILVWKNGDPIITLTTELGHSDAYECNHVKFQMYKDFYKYICNLALENEKLWNKSWADHTLKLDKKKKLQSAR